jgi:hypothetical protein
MVRRGLEARRIEKSAAAFAHRRRPPRLLRTVDVRSIFPACHHRTAAADVSRIRWAFTESNRPRVKLHRQEHQRQSHVSTRGNVAECVCDHDAPDAARPVPSDNVSHCAVFRGTCGKRLQKTRGAPPDLEPVCPVYQVRGSLLAARTPRLEGVDVLLIPAVEAVLLDLLAKGSVTYP